MSNRRMSDTTPNAPDVSKMTANELAAAGWQYAREDSDRCIVCQASVVIITYWNAQIGFASVRVGCEH